MTVLLGSNPDLYQIASFGMSYNDRVSNPQWNLSHWTFHSLNASSPIASLQSQFFGLFLLSRNICLLPSLLYTSVVLLSVRTQICVQIILLFSFLAIWTKAWNWTIGWSFKPGIQGWIATKWIMAIYNDQSAGFGYFVLAWTTPFCYKWAY